ncbi:hypothetical protein BX600DRAFT_429783 [Xylariales sp. PMI_506]|nr:hypothetical protein BX600DRAFT_429783 [Xylariales sp. PMI_506]
MQFKLITPLAAVLLANTVSACMQFGARINGDGLILGAIVDNGETTCTINDSPGTLETVPDWPVQVHPFACVPNFAAWISPDFTTLAYANEPNNYKFAVSNSNGNLAASAFC